MDARNATLPGLVEHCSRIAFDPRLGTVRAWKQGHAGPAVGFTPIDAPREMIHAMGGLPVGLVGDGNIEIIRGDACYQSYICHIPRSLVELGLAGHLDCLDAVVFPAICDVMRNLSGIWKLMFPGVLARYLDVPQDFDPDTGGAFWRHELLELASALEQRGGRPLTDDALRASIATYNRHRAQVRELFALRREQPWRVPTHELYVLMRAGLVVPVEEHLLMLRRYAELVERAEDRVPLDQARVVLAGPFCEQPPLGLIRTLEKAGCFIVDDDLVLVHRWLRHDVPTGGDPLWNLVLAFLSDAIPNPTRYCGDAPKGAELVERVRASGAEGVVFCAPSFCDPALLDQPMAVSAVEEAGIPWTSFKYSENTGQFQVIREQAGTFADSIRLWSEA